MQVIDYTPPRTIKHFITDHLPGKLFYSWIVGPLGSGKTTGNFMKLVYMAGLQARGPDGVRRSRAVVVRNTAPQLKDTTLKSWFEWFKDGEAGRWHATAKDFILKFGDVECEVMFRPLDTAEDVARVLSLEVTFAIIDEFREIPSEIIDALAGRCGRYPSAKTGGATNWGMWGASNPGTEDVWWYDYLHNKGKFEAENSANVQLIELYGQMKQASLIMLEHPSTGVRYFHQPAGDSADAENIANLPGKEDYYISLMRGKTTAWVEQYVRAVWGFSASETPVVKTFRPAEHVYRSSIRFTPHYKLVIGFDPGLAGMAACMGQEDMYGRLSVMGEQVASGMGVTRFCEEKLKPYFNRYFSGADLLFAPDPASANKQVNDERSVVDTLRKIFGNEAIAIETNNRLAKRIDAIESFTMRVTEVGPALIIDQQMCPLTIRALGGGWRYQKMTRGENNRPEPDKNASSHIGDAFGYLCRYFHRQYERTDRRGMTIREQFNQRAFQPVSSVPNYHIR